MSTRGNQVGRANRPEAEIVFEVGSAGGSLSIRRIQNGRGLECFTANRNENALYGLLDEEDREGMVFDEDYQPVNTFPSALQLIEHYQWYMMTPVTVHSDYLSTVMAEVSRHGRADHVRRWRAFLAERVHTSATVQSEPRDLPDAVRYPDRKQRELSDDEKVTIRGRLAGGNEDTHALATEFGCASSQIAGIKAAMNR